MSSNFGIDLIFETQRGNIQSENDVLIVLVHWMMCKNEFRNVGIGDDKIYSDEDRPSELLPQGWNHDQSAYALRYVLNKKIYILHGIVSDDTLLVNILDGTTLKTATVVLKSKQIVTSMSGNAFNDYVSDSQSVIDQITKEIINPMLGKAAPSREEESQPRSTNMDPLLVRPPRHPVVPPMYHDPSRDPLRDPLRDIGRGDLDPFGRGGGMLFRPDLRHQVGPFNPLAPGGVPPGARFDPPNPFGRLDPDNDHMRPPPGYDDMFF